MDYSNMTNEEFDAILREVVSEMSPEQILAIPGVYEEVAEELNNEVLDRWAAKQETADETEDED